MDEKHDEADADNVEKDVCDRPIPSSNEGLMEFVGDSDPESDKPGDEQTDGRVDTAHGVNLKCLSPGVTCFRQMIRRDPNSSLKTDAFKGQEG